MPPPAFIQQPMIGWTPFTMPVPDFMQQRMINGTPFTMPSYNFAPPPMTQLQPQKNIPGMMDIPVAAPKKYYRDRNH